MVIRVYQVHVIRHRVLMKAGRRGRLRRSWGFPAGTVRKYLTEAAPKRKETQARRRPEWDAVREGLERLLAELVQGTGGKQRLTATRLHEPLVAEGHRVGATS